MRFLRSFFLPFLLILYSHVSSNYSTSLPLKTQGALNHRAFRSITDPNTLNAESVSNDGTTDEKDLDKLSPDELKEARDRADEKLQALRDEIKEAREELATELKASSGPRKNYEEKKKESKRLGEIYESLLENKTKADDANNEFEKATDNVTKAEKKFEDAEKVLPDLQSQLDTAIAERDKVIGYPERKIAAESEKLGNETSRPGLETAEKASRDDRETKQKEVTRLTNEIRGLELALITNRCPKKTTFPPGSICDVTTQSVNRLNGDLRTANRAFTSSDSTWKADNEKFDKCKTNIANLEAEIKEIKELLDKPVEYKEEVSTLKGIVKKKERQLNKTQESIDIAADGLKDAQKILEAKKEAKRIADENAVAALAGLGKAQQDASDSKTAFLNAETIWRKHATKQESLNKHIDELEKRFLVNEARLEMLKQVLAKKSTDPAKSAHWMIGVYIIVALLLVAAVFGVVKWRWLKLVNLYHKFRNPKQAVAKDSAAVPPSETAATKQSDASQKQPEGDVQPPPVPTTSTEQVPVTPTEAQANVGSALPTETKEEPKEGKNWSKNVLHEDVDLEDFPENTNWLKNTKNKLKASMKQGDKIRVTKLGEHGFVMYQVLDKHGREKKSIRYFDGHKSYVQNAREFKEGVIDYLKNCVNITSPISHAVRKYTRVTYVAAMTTVYTIKEFARKTLQERAEEKPKETEGAKKLIDAYKKEKAEAEAAKMENSDSEKRHHEKSDEDDKKSGMSDKKSENSKKKTGIRIANKKSKSGKKSNIKKSKDDVLYDPPEEEIAARFNEAPTTEIDDAALSKILHDLFESVKSGRKFDIDPKVKMYILKRQKEHFASQKRYIKKGDGRVNIVADLHGNADNLLHIFSVYGGIDSDAFKKEDFVFLGDLVDRGRHSEEVWLMVGILQLLNPKKVTILRGNHETFSISSVYGFKHELVKKMGEEEGSKFHEYYSYVFSYMPLCCTSNGMFLSHGGFPKREFLTETETLSDINTLVDKFLWDVRTNEIACACTWNDPRFGLEGFQESSRGLGEEYGEDALLAFLKAHKLRGVVRGHQKIQNGFEFFAGDMCCTLFSCSNYEPTGNSIPNDGAFMTIDENKAAYFHILTASENLEAAKEKHNKNVFTTNLHVLRGTGDNWGDDFVVKDDSETVVRSRTDPKPAKKKPIKRSGEGKKNHKPDVRRLDPKPVSKGSGSTARSPWDSPEKKGGPDGPPASSVSHITTKSGREVSQHSK